MNLEDLIEDVGSFGRFQIMTVVVLNTSVMVISMSMLMMTFAGFEPNWWCIQDNQTIDVLNNTSQGFKYCDVNKTRSCTRVYQSDVKSVISEFDLVCEYSWITPTITSIQMLGVTIGSFIGGQTGDLLGRKPACYLSLLFQSLFNILIIFSINWQMFATFRFLIGLAIGAYFVVSSFTIEFVGLTKRALVIAIPFWSIGCCLLAALAYKIPDWRYLHAIVGILLIPYLLGWPMIPESARWLATKNKIEDAKEVIEKIAMMNNKPVPQKTEKIITLIGEQENGGQKYTYWDLFNGCSVLKRTVCIGILWLFFSVIYYAISFNISDLSGNIYLNFFVMNVIQIPIAIPCIYFMNKFGRRVALVTPIVLIIICCLVVVVIQQVEHIQMSSAITGITISGQLLIGSAWTTLVVLTIESYPTVVRNLGLGTANCAAQIGSMIAPFIFHMSSNKMVPYLIMGSMMTICVTCVLLLPETNKMALEDVLAGNEKEIKPQEKTNNKLSK